MKTFGWILIVLGALSFMGAASKGHDVFGPCFFIGLGGLIVYLKREREEDSGSRTELPKPIKVKEPKVTQIKEPKAIDVEVPVSGSPEQNKPLTFEQKEAAICLIAFFAGYNGDLSVNGSAYMLCYQSAVFFGIEDYKEALTKAIPKFQDADKLMDTVITILDRKSKEFLLLTCYDLTKMSKKPEAYELLFNIANEMGYNGVAFKKLIDQYSTRI